MGKNNQFLTAWDNMRKENLTAWKKMQNKQAAQTSTPTNSYAPKPQKATTFDDIYTTISKFDGETSMYDPLYDAVKNLENGGRDYNAVYKAMSDIGGESSMYDPVYDFVKNLENNQPDMGKAETSVTGRPSEMKPTTKPTTPTVSSAVASAMAKLQELRKKTYTDPYGDDLNRMIEEFNNRKAFDYQLNTDQLFLNAREQYIQQGQKAMRDAMGAAATMTGGYGNSYASQVGNQAYQQYLQELNNSIPDFYGSALDRYEAEGQQMLDKINLKDAQRKDDYATWEAKYLRDLENAALDYDMAVADEQEKALQGTTAWDRLTDSEKEENRIKWAQMGLNPDGSPLSYVGADGKVVSSPVGKTSNTKLKTPTQEMYQEALQAYINGGDKGLQTYGESLEGYDPEAMYDWVYDQGPLSVGNLKEGTGVTANLDGHTIGDTALYWGDINDNQTVTIKHKDSDGNDVESTYTMKELYDELEKSGMTRAEILDILKQYQYGYSVNWDNFLSLLPVPLAQQHGAGQNIATLVRWLSDKFGGTDYINAKK